MILLDGVDADEVFQFITVAAVLAGRRADPTHHGRKGIGIGGATEGILLPVHPDRRLFLLAHDGQPAADVLARGATALAGRRLVDIGRTLVGGVLNKDLLGQIAPFLVAVLIRRQESLVFISLLEVAM